jgi:hypothetical protein
MVRQDKDTSYQEMALPLRASLLFGNKQLR